MAVARKTTESSRNLSGNTSKGTSAGGGKGTKKPAAGKKNSRTKSPAKGSAKSADTRKKNLEKIFDYRDHQAFETGITIVAMGIFSLLLYLSYFSLAGNAGLVIGGLMFGFFGWFAWFLPIAVLAGYIFWQLNERNQMLMRKTVGLTGIILSLIALTDLIFNNDTIYEYYKINHVTHPGYFDAMFRACKNVMEWGKFNGGLLGRLFGGIFSVILGRVGATLILFALLVLFVYIFYGVEALSKIRKRNAYRQEMGEIYEQVREDEEYREPSYQVFTFHEKKPLKRPMRELEKVPKVQSFDLRGQAEYFDGKVSKELRKDPVLENLSGQQKPDLFEKKKPEVKIETSEYGKPEVKIGSPEYKKPEVKTESPEHKKPEVKTESQTQTELEPEKAFSGYREPENESGVEDKIKHEIEQIPIYRNELEAKFGRAREKQEVESVEIRDSRVSMKNSFDDESFGFGESAFERFSKKKESLRQVSPEKIDSDEKYSVESFEADRQEVEEEPVVSFEADRQEVEEEPVVSFEADRQEVEEEPVVSFEADRWEVEESPAEGFEADRWEEKDDDFSGSVMIMDDFVPQKPMSSFVPKQEIEKIVLDNEKSVKTAERALDNEKSVKTAGKVLETENRAVENKPSEKSLLEKKRTVSQAENGSRVFADFSKLAQNRQKEEEKKEEPKPQKPYEFPSVDLLGKPSKSSSAASDEELRATALKLQETLESFNVKVKMGAVTCGPSVTRFELLPEQGVRVNKITNLADDLKLSLAAQSIRIEAPIPGKAAVGIEVPNAEASPVSFRELLEGEAFEKSKSPLTFAVGKDIAGKLIMADIAKMPHLLIAGATGSGKSVCINTLIMSILYKADPKDVKLIMIDPKVVELSCYNGIPHLFCPVVTDPKEAAASLNWAVREMMERYNKFEELKVRNIAGYNDKIKRIDGAEEQGYVKMPYLVVIVDEFADLMMVASKDVEDAVCRLAQLARAAGIHLVLATQRPSVNVITGVIKANIPSRIAFSVSSAIDSRTILDRGGAEKLLGKGDMLFFPSGYTEPVRVQGAFVSDQEVTDVVEFLCETNDVPEYNHEVTELATEPQEEPVPEKKPQSDKDEYFADAGRFVIESERAAAGQLQRHFSIGFNRAGRIIDQLEKAGVVGPAAGTKPRAVLMTLEEFETMLNGGPAEVEMMEEAL